jgi:hypothetical protein
LLDVILIASNFFSRDVLKKSCPDFRSRNGSGFRPVFFRVASSLSTAGLVFFSRQSSRRNTVNGR